MIYLEINLTKEMKTTTMKIITLKTLKVTVESRKIPMFVDGQNLHCENGPIVRSDLQIQ